MCPKSIFFPALIILFTLHSFSQNSEIIFDKLLNNERKEALLLAQKNEKSNSNIESILLQRMVEVENGLLKVDPNFLRLISNKEEFQYYLYAFWMSPYFFSDYLENGFTHDYPDILKNINKSRLVHQTSISAFSYLQAIINRYSKNWKGFNSKLNSINAVKDWEFCGVFENLNNSGIDITYEPEKIVSNNVIFDGQRNGPNNWYPKPKTSEIYNFFTNHDEFSSGVHYAQTFLISEIDQRVIIRIGKSGHIKVWLNDIHIAEKRNDHITELDAYSYEVNLSKGVNRILVKLAKSSGVPYFVMRIDDIKGNPAMNITSQLNNRKYEKSSPESLNVVERNHFVETFFRNRIDSKVGSDILNRLALFFTYLRNGKVDDAFNTINPLLLKHPQSSILNNCLTSYYSKIGDEKSISRIKQNLIKLDPDYYLSLLYSVEDFDTLMQLDINDYNYKVQKLKSSINLSYVSNLADLLIELRKMDMAKMRSSLDVMINDKSLPSSIKSTFSEFYSDIFKDDNAAIAVLEDYNKHEFNWELITNLAFYYRKQNRNEDAIELFNEFKEHLGYDNNYYYQIINILHETSQFERSLPYIEKALNNFPSSYLFKKLKADALLQVGNNKTAVTLYKEALRKSPTNKDLRSRINDLEQKTNPLKRYATIDFYEFIDSVRGTEDSNNYGVNTYMNQTNIFGYEYGGGEYRSSFVHEITSKNGIEIFKEYNLGLSGDYTIYKAEIVKFNGDIVPADRNGSNLVFDQLEVNDVILIDYRASYSRSGRFYKDQIFNKNFKGYHPSTLNVYRFISKQKEITHSLSSDNINYRVFKDGDYFVHEWTSDDSEPIPIQEDFMPSFNDCVPRLSISTIETWDEIAEWYSDLVRNQMRIDNVVQSEFDKIFPDGVDGITKYERAKKIYYYITDNFAYSHVNFRQSGYVPQRPSRTIKSRLGDCKDLSTLFVAFSELADIESNLVLILTSDYGKNTLVLPSTDFNHCIVVMKIEKEEIYLELTDKYLPFKALPLSLRNSKALKIPVHNETSKQYDLFLLNPNNRSKSHFQSEYSMKVSEDKSEIQLKSTLNSHLASYYIEMYNNKKDKLLLDDISEEIYNRTSHNVELNQLNSIDYNRQMGEIMYDVNLNIDLEINKVGEYFTFSLPNFVNPYNENIIRQKSRNYPINYIKYENSDSYSELINISIDKGFQFVEVPSDKSFSYEGHEFSISYDLISDDQLKIEINSKVDIKDISVERYIEFKKYVRNVLDTKKDLIKYQLIQ